MKPEITIVLSKCDFSYLFINYVFVKFIVKCLRVEQNKFPPIMHLTEWNSFSNFYADYVF